MSRVAVVMLGARRHYAVPRLLHEAGLLKRFHADSYIGNKPWLERALKAIPHSWRPDTLKRWISRTDTTLPPEKVTSYERFGLWYATARRRVAHSQAARERVFEEAAGRFSRLVGVRGLEGAEIIWGFNGASLELFRLARAQGMRCILEQTILPVVLTRRLLEEEVTRWPGWEPGESDSMPEPAKVSIEREYQEWELADRIVAGSDFVRSGMVELGVPESKISVVPYGVDPFQFPVVPPNQEFAGRRPLRALFAGRVGLRKGVPDLLHALDLLPQGSVELRLAGDIGLARHKLEPWRERVQLLGAVPRQGMSELFRWADVFVLPTVVEGSAMVVYEALMSGVPVVTTPHAGSLVRDGRDGFVVPVRDPKALAQAIGRYVQEPGLLAEHRASARNNRRMAGLDRYRSDLVKVVTEI